MTRQEQFKNELRELLSKYDVDISTEHQGSGVYETCFFSAPDVGTPVLFSGIDFKCRYFDKDSK